MSNDLKICAKCVLPETFPHITFNNEFICNFCQKYRALDFSRFDAIQKNEFEETLNKCRGHGQYDAICCYSGGKDSTYMLKMMTQDLGLSVIAYTLDNGFITDQSKENIRKVVEVLAVDHIFYRPSPRFMQSMYRQAMLGDLNKNRGNYKTRISDVCLSCISLVNTYAARLAIQMKIPMIFAGFTPGQIPRSVIRNNHRFYRETYAANKEHFIARLGPEVEKYFDLNEPDFEIFQMSPFLVYEKFEDQILDSIRSLGWQYPENLDGCSSNCSLNAVGNDCHEKKFGFHPYAFELSQLIRKGLLGREEALEKLRSNVDDKNFDQTLKKLGLTRGELNRVSRSDVRDSGTILPE